MAVLDDTGNRMWPGLRARRLGVLAVLCLAGCMLFELRQSDLGPGFSHRQHVVELEMNCVACHKDIEGRDRPSLPSENLCNLCHKRLDDEKPPERQASAFFVDGVHHPMNMLAIDPEIIFSHKDHVVRVADCMSCHEGLRESERLEPSLQIRMDDCIGCHQRSAVPEDCGTCHKVIDENWEPDHHSRLWDLAHGQAFRNPTDSQSDSCSLCHTESTCVTCHLDEKPASHTNFWRLKSHGFEAMADRSRCQTCHRDDSCARCHESTRPLSHKGMFGQKRNTHCFRCHFPLRNESCFVCHKGTPSHNEATPLPSDHSPAFNCRQCHGVGAPLPHVDDGSSCTACHLP
jgi:hypothetical protein